MSDGTLIADTVEQLISGTQSYMDRVNVQLQKSDTHEVRDSHMDPTNCDDLATQMDVLSIGVNNYPSTTALIPQPKFVESSAISPYISSSPIPLHAIIVAHPITGHIGTFVVTEHPIGPNGELRLIECHQTIVMIQNPTMSWHLEAVELVDGYAEYSALNSDMLVIRNLRVPKMWTVEGQLESQGIEM